MEIKKLVYKLDNYGKYILTCPYCNSEINVPNGKSLEDIDTCTSCGKQVDSKSKPETREYKQEYFWF